MPDLRPQTEPACHRRSAQRRRHPLSRGWGGAGAASCGPAPCRDLRGRLRASAAPAAVHVGDLNVQGHLSRDIQCRTTGKLSMKRNEALVLSNLSKELREGARLSPDRSRCIASQCCPLRRQHPRGQRRGSAAGCGYNSRAVHSPPPRGRPRPRAGPSGATSGFASGSGGRSWPAASAATTAS